MDGNSEFQATSGFLHSTLSLTRSMDTIYDSAITVQYDKGGDEGRVAGV